MASRLLKVNRTVSLPESPVQPERRPASKARQRPRTAMRSVRVKFEDTLVLSWCGDRAAATAGLANAGPAEFIQAINLAPIDSMECRGSHRQAHATLFPRL